GKLARGVTSTGDNLDDGSVILLQALQEIPRDDNENVHLKLVQPGGRMCRVPVKFGHVSVNFVSANFFEITNRRRIRSIGVIQVEWRKLQCARVGRLEEECWVIPAK